MSMSTLTQKLLAAVGLASALLLGAAADASANPWRGPVRAVPVPIYRPAPVVVAPPVYRAPVYPAPVVLPPQVVVYPAPAYGPVYQPVYRPVYQPVYRPVYRPVAWRHPHWVRTHGYRW